RGELRQSVFNLRRQQTAAPDQLAEEKSTATFQCLKHSLASHRKFYCRVRRDQREPIGEIFAQIKRDWTRPQRRRCSCVGVLRGAQTSPANPAGKTEPVEPFGIVVGHTRLKHRRFPCSQWQLATVELFQDGLQALQPFDPMFLVSSLPREKKTIEIVNRDRLNFRAQPVDRQSMNSREQSAIAPFLFS